MKIRYNYLLAFLATGALLAFSILVPPLLLTKDGVLSNPSIVKIGNQQSGSDNSKSTPVVVSPQQQVERVSVFVKSAEASTLSSDSAAGDMGMEDAVKLTIQCVTDLLAAGTIPALAGFPNLPYNVKAELITITDHTGNTALQYWNIAFAIKPEHMSTTQSIVVSLDAQTGLLLSLRIVASGGNTVNLAQIADTIARDMHMQGKVISMTQNTIFWGVLWKFTASKLSLSVNLYQKSGITFLNADMGVD